MQTGQDLIVYKETSFISKLLNKIKQFVNQANQYYAHGIGAYDEKVVKSIFENGLRCSHKELYWTVLEFGKGSETLFKEKEQLMNN